jgi:phage baseplate assembly protein W
MTSLFFDHPLHLDGRGRVATTELDDHIRDLIWAVLFTAPGERVNRPDFGCGVRRLIFQGNSDALATATQFLIQGALQRWLGDLIRLEAVTVENQEEQLTIQVVFTRRDSNDRQRVNFYAPAASAP